MAALDEALRSGILTKAEYDAKKAALLAQSPAAPMAAAPAPAAVTVDSTAPAAPAAAPLDSATPAASPAAPIPATASGPPADGHLFRMKVAKVMDAQGFERPIPSVSMLIPVDWQSQGATTWNLKDKCNTIQTHVVVSGADGRAFEQFPAYKWAWADNPRFLQVQAQQTAQMGAHACDVMGPISAQDYLRRSLPKVRPNAQVVGFEPAPELMDQLQKMAAQTEQAARQYNLRQQVKYDAARVRLRYDLNGKPMEELVVASVIITGTAGPMGTTYDCGAYSAGIARRPANWMRAKACSS